MCRDGSYKTVSNEMGRRPHQYIEWKQLPYSGKLSREESFHGLLQSNYYVGVALVYAQRTCIHMRIADLAKRNLSWMVLKPQKKIFPLYGITDICIYTVHVHVC